VLKPKLGIVVGDLIFDLESTAENFHPQGATADSTVVKAKPVLGSENETIANSPAGFHHLK